MKPTVVIDAGSTSEGEGIEADLSIVGAGAAGIALAARSGRSARGGRLGWMRCVAAVVLLAGTPGCGLGRPRAAEAPGSREPGASIPSSPSEPAAGREALRARSSVEEVLATRRRQALLAVASHFRADRTFDLDDTRDCTTMESHAKSFVASLELHRRGLPGGLDPALAGPVAKSMAETLHAMLGPPDDPHPCNRVGGPNVTNAVVHLAYALHRYGGSWSQEVREAIRALMEESYWPEPHYLHNLDIPLFAAPLLAGEALGRPALFQRGLDGLDRVLERTLEHGGFELNAPSYSAHHVPNLTFLQSLRHRGARDRARILLEFELLASAHLYLPGGGLGLPQSRDAKGGVEDYQKGMLPLIWMLTGDPELELDPGPVYFHLSVAASEYELPEIIRSIFLDKGDGYDFWVYNDAQQGWGRTPNALYRLGVDRAQGFPWQAVVLPGGRAMLGVSYGFRLSRQPATFGVYTRLPDGDFAVLYHHQPRMNGDSDDSSKVSLDRTGSEPEPFRGELYDFERLVHHRTAVSLWDPGPRPGVVRQLPETRAHIPRYGALGGESLRAGAWRVGRVGDDYVAYRPLGTIAEEESRDGGRWTYLRLAGRSGCIVELATRADFPTLADYAADLEKRRVRFVKQPLAAEVDALAPGGGHVRVRLEYRPEKRFVAGRKLSVEEALGHGLMESPWVQWDAAARTLRVERPGYPGIVYDWGRGRVEEGSSEAVARR